MTGQFGFGSMFSPIPLGLDLLAPPIEGEGLNVKAAREAEGSAAGDAAAEIHLRAIREGDADLGTLAPHHTAMPLPAAVVEMQHEDIGQIGGADVDHGAAVGHVGGDAIERAVGTL